MGSYSPTPPTIDLLSSNCNRSCSPNLCLTFNAGDWVSGGATSLWPFPLDVRFLYQAKSSPSGFSQSPSTRQLCLCHILNSWPRSCVTKHWIAYACFVWSSTESWEYLRLSDSGLLSAPSLGTVLRTSSFPLGCLFGKPLTTPFKSNLVSVYLGPGSQGTEKKFSILFLLCSKTCLFLSAFPL